MIIAYIIEQSNPLTARKQERLPGLFFAFKLKRTLADWIDVEVLSPRNPLGAHLEGFFLFSPSHSATIKSMNHLLEITLLPVLHDNYIFFVEETSSGHTAIIDPAAAEPVLTHLKERGKTLNQILLTHHHPDHVDGVVEIKKATNCQVTGAKADSHRLPAVDHWVENGDHVAIGKTQFLVKSTPGHTTGHIAYYSPEESVLFSGDTFFAMGCGRLFEGTAQEMIENFRWLMTLPPATKIYCTHEYTLSNGLFALSIDPDNHWLKERMRKEEEKREKGLFTIPTSVAAELQTNPFCRYSDNSIKKKLAMSSCSDLEVFSKIRQLKDIF